MGHGVLGVHCKPPEDCDSKQSRPVVQREQVHSWGTLLVQPILAVDTAQREVFPTVPSEAEVLDIAHSRGTLLVQPILVVVDNAQRGVFPAVPPEAEVLGIAIGLHKPPHDHRPRHRPIVFPHLAMVPHLVLDYPSPRNQLGLQE